MEREHAGPEAYAHLARFWSEAPPTLDLESVIRDVAPASWTWPRGHRPTRWGRFVSRMRRLLGSR